MTTPDNHNSPNKELREEELHTEGPISEKDEVKQAEQHTAQSQESVKSSVAADLKDREKDKEGH